MASRNYERLSVEDFGRQLITSGDLDPVYIALRRVDWAPAQVQRWLVAYWCFYHCGLASYASSHVGVVFWNALHTAAINTTASPAGGRWPRGQERRHARGGQGMRMVHDLATQYSTPEDFVKYVSTRSSPMTTGTTQPEPFMNLADRVMEHTLFGPWMAFKVADMVERVLGMPVDFEHAHVFMFKDPVKAALMVWRQKCQIDTIAEPKNQAAVILEVVKYLIEEFKDLKAPPDQDRPIGLQEVETVLCCWKSHMNGHYPLFNDIDEIFEGLGGWGTAADQFALAMPRRSSDA